MARSMTLMGPQKGPWLVTYESGRNVVVARTTWTTVVSHPTGWHVVYDEADRAGVLLTPDREPVARFEQPPEVREPLDWLIAEAEAWIGGNAASRGLPGLD